MGPLGAIAACAVLVAALAGTGLAAAPWARLPRRPAGLAWLLALLAGVGLLSAALLGLALARLWFALPVFALVAAGLAAAAGLRMRADCPSSPSPLVAAAIGIPALYGLVWALLPEVGTDALLYHLAAPGQWWLAHGWYPDQAAATWKLPLPFEMLFAWSACLGDDRIAKLLCVVLLPMTGTALVSLAGPAGAGALAAWLLLGEKGVLDLAGRAMSDLAALAWFAAALAVEDVRVRYGTDPGRPARLPAWLPWGLFGFAIAARYTIVLAAPVLFWWGSLRWGRVWRSPARRLAGTWPALVPLLPWWINSALAYGNPFYFVFDGLMPSLGWTAGSREVFRDFVEELAPRDTATGIGALVHTCARLLRDAPGLLVAGLLALRPRGPATFRRVALAAFGLAWLIARVERFDRFGLPADLLLAVAAGTVAAEGLAPGTDRAGLAVLLAAGGLVPAWRALPALGAVAPVRAVLGLEEPEAARARLLGQLAWVQGAVNDVVRPRRILLASEMRIHGFASEVFANPAFGPPLVWTLAREAQDPVEMRKRVRQLGVTHVVHNFVSGAYRAGFSRPFPWDDRMLLLYRGFVRAYLRVAVIPARVDHVQGGFYVYRILPWPERGPALVYDLPGAEGLLADAMTLQHAGDAAAAAREVARLGRLLPDVCHLRNVIGYSFREAGRWDGAYRMYAPGIRAGMVDDENWSGFAAAAAGLGKTDEALVAARRAWELYPAWRGDTDRLLANLEHDRGERALRGGRLAEAEAAYTACLESLARLPRTVDFENATLYASVRLSEALARQGRKREAKERLDAAALVRPALLRTAEARAVLRLIGDKP